MICYLRSLIAPCAISTLALSAFTFKAHAQQALDPIVIDGILVEPGEQFGGQPAEATGAGVVAGYVAFTADSGSRTRTPIEQIPQSIAVIPRKVIEDQQASNLTEITRNISGVQGIERREGTQQLDGDFLVRGQFVETYVNGRIALLDQGFDPRGTINIERVEVLKGPTSSLFTAANGAPISGVVNIVEKIPEKKRFATIEAFGGSFEFANVAFDINQPISTNGDLAFRVTGDARTSGDFVDEVESQFFGIYPTLRYDDGRTVLQFRGRYQRTEYDLYPGLPTSGENFPAFDLPRDTFAAALDQPKTELDAYTIDVLGEHKFTSELLARVRSGFQHSFGDQFSTVTAQGPFFFAGTSDELVRLDSQQYAELKLFDAGGEIVWTPKVSKEVKPTLLVGVEHQSTLTSFESAFAFGAVGDINAVQTSPFQLPPTGTPDTFDSFTTTAILQSQTTFLDRVHVLAGLSVSDARYEIDSFVDVDLEDTIFSPRVGVAVDVTPNFTPFVGWGRGFRSPPTVAASSSFFTVGQVAIERNEQIEAGVRFKNKQIGLSGSVAVFHLEREDAAVFATVSAQTGLLDVADQRSRGFEFDGVWQPTPNWSFIANYAYTDAKIDQDGSAFDGNLLQRVPEHSGRLAFRYLFTEGPLEGLGLGAGVTALSERAGDLGNTFFTDGYAVVDAQASYKVGNVEAQLGIENLFDKEEYVPNFLFQGNVGPLTPVNVKAGLKVTF
ncbi:MAG: TonB-dependent receptor [Filomicrobium sp.]